MTREAINDMVQSLIDDDSDAASGRRARFIQGCNADDTTDSKGQSLRPSYNDAGEPWWM